MGVSDSAFQEIFEHAAVGIAQIALDGTFLRVNDRYCEMLDYPRAELLSKNVRDVNPPNTNTEILSGCRQLQDGVISSKSVEKRYVRKDGTGFWGRLHLSLVRDDNNLPRYFVAVVEDITDKVQVEQSLRERERQLELAQNAAQFGIWSRDLRTNITQTSGYYGALRGLQPEISQIAHEEWLSMIHPGDRQRVETALRECLETTHVWNEEFRVVWPNGSVHWLLVKGQVFVDNFGEPIQLAGVSLDITERKSTEEALRESEERFRLAVKATNDAIWDLDLEKGIIYRNETYSNLYGGPPQGTDSRQWWIDRIHPEDRTRTVEGIRAAISSGASSWTCYYRFQRADGEWAQIHDRAYIPRDAAGRAWRVIGAMQDLTERKQAEAFQREIELQYKEIFENISVCMFLIDVTAEGRFKFAGFNAAEEQAVGLTTSQVAGKFVEEIFPKDLAHKLIENYRRCLNAGRAIRFDDALDLPSGRRYFQTNLIPLRNTEGVTKRIIGACVDMTDLRRTQEESLAKQNLESLGVLAGGIAHDFNNVLGGIYSQAELIEDNLAAGPGQHTEIQKIKSAALRGSEIVRELMVYAGQDETYADESIDLSSLIRETLSLIGISISKHAALTTVLGVGLPPISGKPPKIRQVVMNLIINASESIGAKRGTITVTTECVKGKSNQGSAGEVSSADYIRLEVSDTGDGIPDDAKARIFDPFFTTKFAGRGMGLAVVNKVVHDHGGSISVSSAPDRGTTFHVFFPCITSHQPKDSLASSADWPLEAPQRSTLLVVEDEELLRTAVSKSLRKFGCSVLEAHDGSEAIALIRANRETLEAVLLDVTLPGISSTEIVEEARRIRPDLKIVFTSAYSKESVDRTFPGIRIEHFIRKPFPIMDLRRLLMPDTAAVS